MSLIESARWPRPLDPPKLLLPTDPDGTLPAGAHAARRRVRELPGARLVFVAGRGPGPIMPPLAAPAIPTPGYIFDLA